MNTRILAHNRKWIPRLKALPNPLIMDDETYTQLMHDLREVLYGNDHQTRSQDAWLGPENDTTVCTQDSDKSAC
jgi:hypothetical protein